MNLFAKKLSIKSTVNMCFRNMEPRTSRFDIRLKFNIVIAQINIAAKTWSLKIKPHVRFNS